MDVASTAPIFTVGSDEQIVSLIVKAKIRLVIVAPALSTAVADALSARMSDLPQLSLSIIIDADAEVYRMGYGDVDALNTLRNAAAAASLRLREQPGVRIGVIVSDEDALIFAPTSKNVEAGSTKADKPNALLLRGDISRILAEKAGAPSSDPTASQQEVGLASLSVERVLNTLGDLERNPPLPVNLQRKLRVFINHVQYVELKVKGYKLSRLRAALPKDFIAIKDEDLKKKVTGQIQTPFDGLEKVNVKIEFDGASEIIGVNEAFLDELRQKIERNLTLVMPKRGRLILRRHRRAFDYQVGRLKAIISAYQAALLEEIEKARDAFKDTLIKEFLKPFRESPPVRFQMMLQLQPSDDELRTYIKECADEVFNEMVKLDGPEISIVYKDIAIEDLENPVFMATLKETLLRGGVSSGEITQLFEAGEAASAQGSFASLL